MEILFVATELSPFVKVGGLADVMAALPKALRTLGHRVTVLVPRFPAFEAQGLLVARRLTPLKFSLGDRPFEVTVFDGRLASQVDVVLVDAPGLYDRAGVYGEEGRDYDDNATRFAVLARAAVELIVQRAQAGAPFDVVHVHDWPSALVPVLLKDAAVSTKSLLTIHNMAHQGVFPKEALADLGLSPSAFTIDGVEFYGRVNVMKGGILTADAVSTVSPTYAREIQTSAAGYGLEGVMQDRAKTLVGITNGIDYGIWNPATDPALPTRYDAEDRSGRAICRGALQKQLELTPDTDVPIVGSVGRLVHQKGVDVLLAALPSLLRSTDAQFVIMGDGAPDMVSAVADAALRSHGRVKFVRAASEAAVHHLFGASDFVLLPSRYEPCGLVQLYAQRYGALPIAHATGGLRDTIIDCDAKLETGTGFLFEELDPESLVSAVLRAISARAHPRWHELVRRVMRIDRAWDRPARQYEQIYRGLIRG